MSGEIMTLDGLIRQRAQRKLASRINTSASNFAEECQFYGGQSYWEKIKEIAELAIKEGTAEAEAEAVRNFADSVFDGMKAKAESNP